MEMVVFTFNPFSENSYIVYDETKECVIIDPGCYDDQEWKALKGFITEQELKPVRLLNTHCHIDHVFGNHLVLRTSTAWSWKHIRRKNRY